MTKDEALKLALGALESADWYTDQLEMIVYCVDDDGPHESRAKMQAAIAAIKEVLAQPEQEPVAWLMYKGTHKDSFWFDKGDAYNFEMTPEHRWEPLYTTPPQRPWVDEEAVRADEREACAKIVEDMNSLLSPEIAAAIRARKNT